MKTLVLLALILSMGVTEAFSLDFTGDSSGFFNNPIAGSNGSMTTSGVGTSTFTWGDGSGSPPSSLTFNGTSFSGYFEQEFKFGQLQYYNGAIVSGTGADGVTLNTLLALTTPTGITQSFAFNFGLINTPNVGSAADAADYVQLDNLVDHSSSFIYDGNTYYLQFTRFDAIDSFGSSLNATEFHVFENALASADLYGKLTVNPVPEPSTLLLLAAGLAGLAVCSRKRIKK